MRGVPPGAGAPTGPGVDRNPPSLLAAIDRVLARVAAHPRAGGVARDLLEARRILDATRDTRDPRALNRALRLVESARDRTPAGRPVLDQVARRLRADLDRGTGT